MTHLSKLNDQDLVEKIKSLAKEERRITQEVLEHLREVEARRLYAARGYGSLFEFCIKELGYSEGSAQRRISSMRLIKILPEAKEKLQEGGVSLSTLSQLQSFIRKEEAHREVKLSIEKKRGLLELIENKSQKECEREFVKISPEVAKLKETERQISVSLTEIKFMAGPDLVEKLKTLKNLTSHKNKSHSTAELIGIMADIALIKLVPKEKPLQKKAPQSKGARQRTVSGISHASKCSDISQTKVQSRAQNNGEMIAPLATKLSQLDPPLAFTAAAEVKERSTSLTGVHSSGSLSAKASYSRRIPAILKKHVWERDQGVCQYQDPLTKRKCGSSFRLQYEHRVPVALGGEATLENIELLCATHNQWRAIKVFGLEKVRRHFEP